MLTIHLVTMVFRRSLASSIRPVHRIKHVVDTQFALTPGTTGTTVLVNTVDAPVLANQSDVETGSKINGIYLVVEVTRTGTTSDVLPNVYMLVAKNPGGNLTLPAPNVVGINDNKRYVIHQEMIMLQGFNASNPRTLFKGVIVLPRGYRRMGPNDQLTLLTLSPGVNISVCVQSHYKEFR